MKKILLFGVITLAIIIGAIVVDAETSTTTEITDVTATTTTISETSSSDNQVKTYYYYDYQGLISQIYQDVYDDIYEDLYSSLINRIDDDFYNQIYTQVQTRIDALLEQEEFQVYADDLQEMIYDVVDIANGSVIGIANYLGDELKAVGSAVVYYYDDVSETYYLITNEHVIADGNNFRVVFEDGLDYEAILLGYDTEVDIAILSFQAQDKQVIVSQLGDSDSVQKGTVIIAAGNPQGFNFFGSVTLGLISGLNRKVDTNQYIDYIQHDSAINAGNSGGPIYNLDGEVIGINVSKYASTEIEGMGFAIPINLVKRIISRIEEGTLTDNTIMPRLGAKYYDISKYFNNGSVTVPRIKINGEDRFNFRIELPIGVEKGFILYEINRSLTLGLTDIDNGDLIYQINEFQIDNEKDFFVYLYNNYEAGDEITISYYDFNHLSLEYETEPISITVTLR